jgi:ankyrin repeat protein
VGAEVNAPAGRIDGRTALQAAARKGNIPAVKILLNAGADVGAPATGGHGMSALYTESQHHSQTTCCLL